ncbi:MAG TPA: hypothetical protein VF733_00115 [Candidatus Saccharimonadales bacterium]
MEESSANNQAAHSIDNRPSRKKLIYVAIAVAILLILGLVIFLVNKKDDKNSVNSASQQQAVNNKAEETQPKSLFAGQYLQGCQENKVSFTHSPVPLSQMGYVEPMGKMNDGHVTPTDHVYISPLNFNAADNTTDVVMPADGIVAEVAAMPAQYIGDRQQQTAPEDHRLVVVHNCQYVSIFIHVHRLSPALKAAVGGLQPNEGKRPMLSLKAGDSLGKIGGNPVDWSLMDSSKTLDGFITPSLYQGESWKIHVIDPISVYSGTLKEQLIAKSLRSSEPYGGKIDYDKKGALIGNWFREGTNGYQGADQSRYWDGHLAVVPNYIDSSATMVSLGNWQGKAAQFSVKGNVSPAEVTAASGMAKYELIDSMYVTADGRPWNMGLAKGIKVSQQGSAQVKGVVAFQVLNGEKLRVELFPGKTAAQVNGFTSAAQTYVR